MSNKNDLVSGVNALFGGGKVESQIESEENQEEAMKPKPRTFLTGRRRRDDPRPLASKEEDRTSLILNKTQYAKVRAIALRESMTIKDMVYEMFKLGIEKYEKKHGPVDVGEHREDKNIF